MLSADINNIYCENHMNHAQSVEEYRTLQFIFKTDSTTVA
jgi:hypothetical protein